MEDEAGELGPLRSQAPLPALVRKATLMPRFLNTRGNPTLGIGICGRCSQKFPLADLKPDPNAPGLMVCDADRDQLDPYRLPARQVEDITLPFVRPDEPLTVPED